MKIILASASLGRKKILTDLGLKFTVRPAKIDEQKITASNPITLVKKIAKTKAEAVIKILMAAARENCGEPNKFLRNEIRQRRILRQVLYRRKFPLGDLSNSSKNYLIIAADSMVYFQEKTYGKPKDKKEAKKFLRMLSGQTHEFITGVCIILASQGYTLQKPIIKSCKSWITFEKFTPKEIEDYVRIANVTSYAGGYAPDFAGGEIIKRKMKIKGSISNVLGGLPLEILLPILKENGVKI